MKLLVLVLFLMIASPSLAHAQCVNPAGGEGDVIYNSTHNVPQYCDGSDNWIAMVGADPTECPPGIASCGGKPDERVVFALQRGRPRDYGGISGIDASCQNAADSAGYHGIYYAWIADSDPNSAPVFRFEQSTVPYVRPDGWTVANNWTDLTDGTLDNDVRMNTSGTTSFFTSSLITNVAPDGTQISATDHCGDFDGGSGTTTTGNINSTTSTWTDSWNGYQCTSASNVACFEQGNIRRTEVVPDGLIGHWRLDEDNAPFVDGVNANDATETADVIPADSPVGGGQVCGDGGKGYITAPATQTYRDLRELTFSAWIRPDFSDNHHGILEIDDLAKLRVTFQGDIVGFGADAWDGNVGGWTANNTPLTFGIWTHVVVTYDYNAPVGTPPIIYINGEPEPSLSTPFSPAGSVTPPADGTLRICSMDLSGIRNLEGAIDDVRIYNRILSADEIVEIYEARDGVRYNESHRTPEFFDGNKWVAMPPPWPDVTDGLVAHWKLDEMEGVTALDSASSETGTLTGEPPASFDVGAVGPGSVRFYGSNRSTSVALSGNQVLSAYDPYTISGWMKLESATFLNRAYAMYSTGTNDGTGCNRHLVFGAGPYASANATYPFVRSYTSSLTSETMVSTNQLTVGEWAHVAFVYDGANMNFYIDGELDGSVPYIQPFCEYSTPGSGGRIGSWSNDSGTFTTNGLIDDLRLYDRELSQVEIEKLYRMGTPVGISTALPQDCPSVGDVCDDGTVYAGLSPDGNVEMFATGVQYTTLLPFNNGNSSDYQPTGTTSLVDGDGNTRTLVVTDSDTGTAGFQPHQAAEYCYNLNAHGADDWFLPARDELREFVPPTGSEASGVFQDILDPLSGTFPDGIYITSSEVEADSSEVQLVRNGASNGTVEKHRTTNIICVRKGPAPRCENPYGREGDMFYNTTHDVVQYCDGARWVAIGKTAP